ncbi:MAG: class I SAM-dependent methyltransferase [Dehalococcoidia bacterium]|nr:class I SAM-dependent methyltransferase [Dehalococcoidia bacterium]
MSEYAFKQRDFERPSLLFRMEDALKGILGCPLLYNPYYQTFGLKGDEKMLDFGCGGGAGSRCLAGLLNRGGRLTCVDSSRYWIEKAKQRLAKYPNVECLQGDIRQLNIPAASFDVVSVIHVIHDITPVERSGIVNALGSALKKGGKLFIRERIARSHGMPVEEIRSLLSAAGMNEIACSITKTEYAGRYDKTG